MSYVSFNEYDPKAHRWNNGNGKLVFVKGQNTQAVSPLVFRPFGKIFIQSGIIYDPGLKKNRMARNGEDSRTQYLFNGVDINGVVKTFIAGSSVVQGIKTARVMLGDDNIWVQVTSTGTGLKTEYHVLPFRGRVPSVDLSGATLPDLEKIARSLLADSPSLPTGLTPVAADSDDMAFASADDTI